LRSSNEHQIAQIFLSEFSIFSLSAPAILVNFALRPANLSEIRSRASARAAAAASPRRFCTSCLELKLRTSHPSLMHAQNGPPCQQPVYSKQQRLACEKLILLKFQWNFEIFQHFALFFWNYPSFRIRSWELIKYFAPLKMNYLLAICL
jgi:hypothetical protein